MQQFMPQMQQQASPPQYMPQMQQQVPQQQFIPQQSPAPSTGISLPSVSSLVSPINLPSINSATKNIFSSDSHMRAMYG
jgi:hypothetical protein